MSEETEVVDTPWYESVDWSTADGYEPSDKIKEFKDVAHLGKSYDALRKDNSSKIRIPGDTASDEERATFKGLLREHLGIKVPESPDKYSFKAPDGMEQYFEGMEEQLKAYHEAGLSDDAVSLVLGKQADTINTLLETMKNNQAEIAKNAEAALKEKWGSDYDERIAGINSLKEKYPDVVNDLTAAGLANSQPILEMLDEVKRSVSEDAPLGESRETLQSIEEELAEIKKKPGYMNARASDHAEIMGKVRSLQRKRVQKT